MQENYRNRPALLIGLAIVFFILFTFIPGGIQVGPFLLKPVDPFMDIKPDSLISYSLNEHEVIPFETNKLQMDAEYASAIDINLLYNTIFGAEIPDQNGIPPTYQKLSGNISQMNKFFDALKNSKTSQVRVAHYGDSEIEGDLITGDFRQNLQGQFGGTGAGFLSITSQDIAFRTTTKQTFSSNWDSYSVFSGNSKNIPIGLDGAVAVPKGKAWVQYETTGRFKNLGPFDKVRIFYSNAKPSSSISYSFNGGSEKTASLTAGSSVNELVLSADDSKSFKMTAADGSANFFGVSLESATGVYVDNFPLRGNTGVSIRDFSPQILKDFNKLLNYKLIILSFGLNIASSSMSDYGWYEKEMIKVVTLLKSSFPQASILIVGVGDKGMKRGSSFITDPNIPKLVETQRNIATKSGVAFWDLYEAMGGENSIAKWVNAKPPLAMKDYTHVNLQGAEKIAQLLTSAIMDEYKK